MKTTPIRKIAVIMAMRAEAAPILGKLGAVPKPLPAAAGSLPFQWFETRELGLDLVIALNGVSDRHGVDKIATQPAVLNAYVTLLHCQPDLVISAGTAGGWGAHGTNIGDVFVSADHFVYHDRRIPLQGFDEYGIGAYPAVNSNALAKELQLKQGIVTSGNSLDESDVDRDQIKQSGARVKDMEAAAVAYVAEMLGVPVLAVKAITDLVDSPADTATEFEANLSMASERLSDSLCRVVAWCSGKTIADMGGT